MKKTYVIGGAAVLTAALLAGCNSNGDDGSVPAVGPTTTTLTVTPSLGRISNGRVVLRNAATGNQIGTPRNLAGGSASFPDVPLGIPVIAEVQPLPGASNITYFDEGAGVDRQISGAALNNFHLRAALGNVGANENLGITAFTEAAVRRLPVGNLSRAQIDNINNAVRTQLANAGLIPSAANFDITDAPSIVDAVSDYASLGNNIRGQYAGLLAMYANAVRNRFGGNTPAIDFLNNLATDLEDGDIDGSGGAINFNADQFEAAMRQAALQLRDQLPASLDALADGITFSGGGSTNGNFGTVTIDGDQHQATSAAKVTVNGITTITWSDGTGSLSLVTNNTGTPVSFTFTTSEDAGFLSCANNACAGITVNSNAKTVQFSNITIPNLNPTGQAISVNGTLSTDITAAVNGSFTLQAGSAVTSTELAKLAGSSQGTGILMTITNGVPGNPANTNCSSTITNAGQMSVSGGGFSITAQPNAQSIVTNTNVVANGQAVTFRSVTLVEVGQATVGTATVVFDNAGKIYTIAGSRSTINIQNPAAFNSTTLTCSAMQ